MSRVIGPGTGLVVAALLVMATTTAGAAAATSTPPTSGPDSAAVAPETWQRASSSPGPDFGFTDIERWDGGFAAIGWQSGPATEPDEITVPVWLSVDGTAWYAARGAIPLPNRRARVSQLVAYRGGLLAVGAAGNRLAVWRSGDGGSWPRLDDRPALAAAPSRDLSRYAADIWDAVGGHGRVVVSGSYWTRDVDPSVDSQVWTSRDGRRWQRELPALPPPDNGIIGLAAAPRGFVGLSSTNRRVDCDNADGNVPVRSRDGRTWRAVREARLVCGLRSITYHEPTGRYYGAGETPAGDAVIVFASDDLRSWEEVYRLPSEFEGSPWRTTTGDIDSAGDAIVVVGEAEWEGGERDGATVWALVSDDGHDWVLTADWLGIDAEGRTLDAWAMDADRVVVASGREVWYADLLDLGIEAASQPEPSMSAAQLYALLGEQAAAGNREAVELGEAVDAYLEERGLTLEDLPPPERTAERISDGMVILRLEGFEPWSLTIRNGTEVDDADQLAAYRDLRHAALRSIAGSTPDREIEVAVTPDAFVGISEFLEALAWDGAVERSRADVWRGSEWVMEAGTQVETAPERLQPVLEEQVSSTLDLYPDLRLDDLDLTVRQLRLRIPASEAAKMVDAEGVLLVDPFTDVLDRFADRAALAELANAPDVFRSYAEYALGRELVPGGITPELQSAD